MALAVHVQFAQGAAPWRQAPTVSVCAKKNSLLQMAGENAAEVAALKGWQIYFNTITTAGRRNVRNQWPCTPWLLCKSLLFFAAGHCYVGHHLWSDLAEPQEKAEQGQQGPVIGTELHSHSYCRVVCIPCCVHITLVVIILLYNNYIE